MVEAEVTIGLEQAKGEADALTTRILELRDAYYERNEVLVDDAEYDRMMHRLEELEHLFPELQGPPRRSAAALRRPSSRPSSTPSEC